MRFQSKYSYCFFTVFLLFLSLNFNKTLAQKLLYSEPVGNVSYTYSKFIGRVKNNIIVYKYNPLIGYSSKTKPQILVYDDEMKLINRTPFDFMKAATSTLDFINEENSFSAILQYFENGYLICKQISFDADGNLLNIKLLERSTRLDDDKYVVVQSPDRKGFALLKAVPSNIQNTIAVQYYFIKSDSLIHSDKIMLPFDTLSSALSKAFLMVII